MAAQPTVGTCTTCTSGRSAPASRRCPPTCSSPRRRLPRRPARARADARTTLPDRAHDAPGRPRPRGLVELGNSAIAVDEREDAVPGVLGGAANSSCSGRRSCAARRDTSRLVLDARRLQCPSNADLSSAGCSGRRRPAARGSAPASRRRGRSAPGDSRPSRDARRSRPRRGGRDRRRPRPRVAPAGAEADREDRRCRRAAFRRPRATSAWTCLGRRLRDVLHVLEVVVRVSRARGPAEVVERDRGVCRARRSGARAPRRSGRARGRPGARRCRSPPGSSG